MRTSLLSLLGLLIVVPVSATAQEPESGSIYGIKGGVSFGNLSNDEALPGDLETRTGFTAGIYGGARMKSFAVGIDLLYSQRGLRSDVDLDEQTRLDYIDIPLYLRFMINIPAVQPYIYGGPQIAFEINCETAGGGDCPDTGDRAKTDILGVVGLGLRFGSVSGVGVGVEARYLYGVKNLKVTGTGTAVENETRSFAIVATIGR